jgi:general secretion pathway protein A
MFLQFYRLREQPFGVTPNPRFLYHSPVHREALASLVHGIRSDVGFAALIAEPGLGKTTLLFELLDTYQSAARTALIFQTLCTPLEFMRYLLNELEVETHEQDPVRLYELFKQVLVKEARAGHPVIIIIDEAQNLDDSVLESVRLLSDFETPRKKLLHIILAGQPGLGRKLAQPHMAQLLQRIAMLTRLHPLSAKDVRNYVYHRLLTAGYTGPPLFTPEAFDLIVEHSRGVPRMINRICFNAMSIGFALGKRELDGDVIREVIADLDINAIAKSESTTHTEEPGEKPIRPTWARVADTPESTNTFARQTVSAAVASAPGVITSPPVATMLSTSNVGPIIAEDKTSPTLPSVPVTSPALPRSTAAVTPPLPASTSLRQPVATPAGAPVSPAARPAAFTPPSRQLRTPAATPRNPAQPIEIDRSRWVLRLVLGALVPIAILVGWLIWQTRPQISVQPASATQSEPASDQQIELPSAPPDAPAIQSQPSQDKQPSRSRLPKHATSPSGITYRYNPGMYQRDPLAVATQIASGIPRTAA